MHICNWIGEASPVVSSLYSRLNLGFLTSFFLLLFSPLLFSIRHYYWIFCFFCSFRGLPHPHAKSHAIIEFSIIFLCFRKFAYFFQGDFHEIYIEKRDRRPSVGSRMNGQQAAVYSSVTLAWKSRTVRRTLNWGKRSWFSWMKMLDAYGTILVLDGPVFLLYT